MNIFKSDNSSKINCTDDVDSRPHDLTMTVSVCWCMVSWSSLSAVYNTPVPGSSLNLRRLNGSVLLRRVKVS